MVDAEAQGRAWQSGEQERQGGEGLGQVIKAGWGTGYDGGQGASQAMMDGLAEGWAKGRARLEHGDRQDVGQQIRQSGGVTGAGDSGG